MHVSNSRASLPIAIVIAGALIAGAMYFGGTGAAVPATDTAQQPSGQAADLGAVRPVTAEDHIRGNPDAPVTIVEYSDMECPFCKRFHDTMQQVMDEYGASGQVAWVYRHFPLDQLHPVKARAEAVAAECANELGGNEAFWKFTDRFFELTPSNNQTDVETVLPQIAREIGLDAGAFAECRSSGRYDDHVQADLDNAIATGGNGTPWSIVIGGADKRYPIAGAQPYDVLKQVIDAALKGQ